MLRDLWRYRLFIFNSIKSSLIDRFANNKLGALWVIINPLSQTLIYAIIFSNVLSAKLSIDNQKYTYAIYLMAGLLAWFLFNEIINRLMTLFIDYGNIIKKINFPNITLPVIASGSCLLNNVLLLLSIVIISILLGHKFYFAMLWLFPLYILVIALSVGIGMILGIINIFIRDVQQITTILLQILFWFTPIVYPITIIPNKYNYFFNFNPIYHIVSAYHDVILYGRMPPTKWLATIFLFSFFLLIFSLFLFRRSSKDIEDVL